MCQGNPASRQAVNIGADETVRSDGKSQNEWETHGDRMPFYPGGRAKKTNEVLLYTRASKKLRAQLSLSRKPLGGW